MPFHMTREQAHEQMHGYPAPLVMAGGTDMEAEWKIHSLKMNSICRRFA